jgi:hypothetical protein
LIAVSEALGLGGTRKPGGNQHKAGNRGQQGLLHSDLLRF